MNIDDDQIIALNRQLEDARRELIVQRNRLPRLNIKCEYKCEKATGTMYLPVTRVEAEDDGSFTAVTSHWPGPL
jgi:hypothetical protein